jgi:hypothetical protein
LLAPPVPLPPFAPPVDSPPDPAFADPPSDLEPPFCADPPLFVDPPACELDPPVVVVVAPVPASRVLAEPVEPSSQAAVARAATSVARNDDAFEVRVPARYLMTRMILGDPSVRDSSMRRGIRLLGSLCALSGCLVVFFACA